MRRGLTFRNLKQNPLVMAAMVLSIGLIAVLAGPWNRVANRGTVALSSPPKVLSVFAASHALPAGTEIGPKDFTTREVLGSAPAGAASSQADVIGRITAKPYAAKEVFLRDSLRDPSTLGIAAHVRPGQRAFAIRIAEDDIVGGFLQSGDHVDVFATIPGSVFPSKTAADVPDRSQSVLLLQNILVLAVGENPATHGSVQSSARTVSLELTPDGLARLALAERFGKVSLAIRKPGDDAVAQSSSAVLADLLPGMARDNTPEPQVARTEPVRRHSASGIPVYLGTHSASLSIGGSR
jgi:pilus assembly protein CpaB